MGYCLGTTHQGLARKEIEGYNYVNETKHFHDDGYVCPLGRRCLCYLHPAKRGFLVLLSKMSSPEQNPFLKQRFVNTLQNILREGYNTEPDVAKSYLALLRNGDEEEGDPAFLTPQLVEQIENGEYGHRIHTIYLRLLQFCDEELSPDQILFLNTHRQLLY